MTDNVINIGTLQWVIVRDDGIVGFLQAATTDALNNGITDNLETMLALLIAWGEATGQLKYVS